VLRPRCPDVGPLTHRRTEEHATTPFAVRREELDDLTVLHVRGEVDLSNVEQLERALQEVCDGDHGRILVDTSRISFLSSVGVMALVRAQARCQAGGLDFAVVAARRPVLRPLQATGMDQLLKIFPSLEAARQGAED
jgi:anti-sigma B factor antagonist